MLKFWKYHGAGNDFVLLDCTHSTPCDDLSSLARHLCDRRHGIGADGLLLLLPSTLADYRMRIFNADGSEPSMCGNGIRCLADYIFKRDNRSEATIETNHIPLKCRRFEDDVAVALVTPEVLLWRHPFQTQELYWVNTGVPHAVLFVDALDKIPVNTRGREIRFDPLFAPHGANVNFASIAPDGSLAVRTYERGVEAETLACGTGAAATAFVAAKVKNLPSPISIKTRSTFDAMVFHSQLRFVIAEKSIEMIGPAREVFTGMGLFFNLTFQVFADLNGI